VVILRDQTEDCLLHQVNYTAAQADISKSESNWKELPVSQPGQLMMQDWLSLAWTKEGSVQMKGGGWQWGVPGDKP